MPPLPARLPALALALAVVSAVACGADAPSFSAPEHADAGHDGPGTDAPANDVRTNTDDASALDDTTDEVRDAQADAGPDPRFDAIRSSIERERARLDAPGVSVAIVEHGELTFAEGFGFKAPDGADPVLPTTLFRIGSVTKVLTATGLLRLVDQGLVRLDAPITDYLPTLTFRLDASWAPSIHVRHLLTHQSALVDSGRADCNADDSYLSSYLLTTFPRWAYLMAPPGRMFNYSNTGYMYVGLLAETVGGAYYRDYLTEHVLRPLGMDRTFFLPSEVLSDGDYATGLTTDWATGDPSAAPPDSYDCASSRPSGFAFSSAPQLARFLLFLTRGDPAVLSDELRAEMQSPQADEEVFLDRAYGYGLFINQGFYLGNSWYDVRMVQHGGDIPGFAATMAYVPHCDVGYVALANADSAHFEESLDKTLRDLCALPSPAEEPDTTVDPASFDTFVGAYIDPFEVGLVQISREESKLVVRAPELDDQGVPYAQVLTPIMPHNFEWIIDGLPLLVTFLMDGNGQVEYLRTRLFVAKRESELPADAGASAHSHRGALSPSDMRARLHEMRRSDLSLNSDLARRKRHAHDLP